jgi:ankyrin repeat protein
MKIGADATLIRLLSQVNVVVDDIDGSGQTALEVAIRGANLGAAEILLDRGAMADARFTVQRRRRADGFGRARREIWEDGAGSCDGEKALIAAVLDGRTNLAISLLDHGANAHDIGRDGETALGMTRQVLANAATLPAAEAHGWRALEAALLSKMAI